VFSVDRQLLQEINLAAENDEPMERFKGRTTLTLIQSIKTVPAAFCTTMNTCGRICVHKIGRFVIVSNRGHESIAIFRVRSKGPARGQLGLVGYYHTRGETPRHFQFDSSGQFLIVANQDTDSVAVFAFNLSSGELKYTGHEYRVPSPNFICSCPLRYSDHMPPAVSLQEANKVPITLRGINSMMRPDLLDSDLDESDGSTMAVNDTEALQKQLAEALRQVEELRAQLTGLTIRT
jgi:6-phosphogluconolactonase